VTLVGSAPPALRGSNKAIELSALRVQIAPAFLVLIVVNNR
jgi:hypothetical protein